MTLKRTIGQESRESIFSHWGKVSERYRIPDKNTQMGIISFYEVDFSFDLPYLQQSFAEPHGALKDVVRRHLNDKSVNHIDEVFGFFGNAILLETAFKPDLPYREIMGKVVSNLNDAKDNGDV